MKKNILIAVWFTLVTTVIFGVIYPLAVTGMAQLLFHDRANGQLIEKNGKLVGSRIIGQAFSGPGYFHSLRLRRVLDMIQWRAAVLTWLLPTRI
jgi:K+-transporting ATPase ATPase C chain